MQRMLLSLLSLLLLACQATSPQPAAQSDYPDLSPLVTQVAQSREAQRAGVAQFQAVREQVLQLANLESGENLQALSAAMESAYDASIQAAVAMNASVDAVQETADTLFRQWEIENEVYTDARLKAASETKLTQTWQNYEALMQVLKQSGQVNAMLADFHTAVVALRDSPNAGAVAARKVELDALANDVAAVVQQINGSIDQSDAFITSVQQ